MCGEVCGSAASLKCKSETGGLKNYLVKEWHVVNSVVPVCDVVLASINYYKS